MTLGRRLAGTIKYDTAKDVVTKTPTAGKARRSMAKGEDEQVPLAEEGNRGCSASVVTREPSSKAFLDGCFF